MLSLKLCRRLSIVQRIRETLPLRCCSRLLSSLTKVVELINLSQLVTYSQLSRQWAKWQLDVGEKKVDPNSVEYPLFCMDWYRMISEESHYVRRWDSKSPGRADQAVLDFTKMHGLCLSGTLMQVSYLGCHPSP